MWKEFRKASSLVDKVFKVPTPDQQYNIVPWKLAFLKDNDYALQFCFIPCNSKMSN